MFVYKDWLHDDLRIPQLAILLGVLAVPVSLGVGPSYACHDLTDAFCQTMLH